jgi:hypothetical protein
MKAPVDQGADAAIQLLDSMRDHVDCMPLLERAQWFCGFINATAAWSMGSVGWHHTETMLLAAIEIVPRAQDNGTERP